MIESDEQNDVVEVLQKSFLFGSLSRKQLRQLQPLFKINTFEANVFILNENDLPVDLYLILEGSVEILKKTNQDSFRIATLPVGEVFGEMGLIDNSPRSASVRTLSSTKLLSIPINELKNLANEDAFYNQLISKLTGMVHELTNNVREQSIYSALVTNLSSNLSVKIRQSNLVTVDSLKNELKQTKARVAMGKFMMNALFALSVYIFVFKITEQLASSYVSVSLITIPIIIFLSVVMLIIMKTSGYSMAFYGLTLENWRASLKDAFIVTLILIFIMIFSKWFAIHFIPQFHNLSIINLNNGTNNLHTINQPNHFLIISIIIGYLIFSPIQELICRGALQSSLQEFLSGPYRIWWAIIMSNILFSVSHMHISLVMSLVAFFSGLFWGWVYSRNKTLIGVALSHTIVGGLAFFVFDLKSLVMS